MAVTAEEWIKRFAGALGAPVPSPEEVNALLELAGVAAHASERTAAPITCWLVARANVDSAAASTIAERLAAEIGD